VGRIGRNPQGAAVGLTVVAALVFVGLFVKSYRDAGPDAAGGAEPALADLPRVPAVPMNAPTERFLPPAGATTLPGTVAPANPHGLSLGHAGPHALVLTVTSAAPIPRLGYMVPTSPHSSSGDVPNPGRKWSLSTTVVGRPAYAAVFVQAGPTGTPVTCRVSVDGVTTNVRTTSGPYGRAVCLG
jgi:hypothetical protein